MLSRWRSLGTESQKVGRAALILRRSYIALACTKETEVTIAARMLCNTGSGSWRSCCGGTEDTNSGVLVCSLRSGQY